MMIDIRRVLKIKSYPLFYLSSHHLHSLIYKNNVYFNRSLSPHQFLLCERPCPFNLTGLMIIFYSSICKYIISKKKVILRFNTSATIR